MQNIRAAENFEIPQIGLRRTPSKLEAFKPGGLGQVYHSQSDRELMESLGSM